MSSSTVDASRKNVDQNKDDVNEYKADATATGGTGGRGVVGANNHETHMKDTCTGTSDESTQTDPAGSTDVRSGGDDTVNSVPRKTK